ncbi:TRAP transporter small permease subunit [Maricaulis sp. CAU 1757]
MRPGDRTILVLLAFGLALAIVDAITQGGVTAWSREHLPGLALQAGHIAGWIGLAALPVLVLPLLTGVTGRFGRLPDRVWDLHRRAIQVIDTISLTIGGAARWFALGLVVVTVVVVIQRYVFGFASTKLQESVIYMHALLFLLASASTLLADGHVRVDVFYAKADARGKAWTNLLGTYLALIPTCLLILWASTGYLTSTWRILESSRESDGLAFVYLLKTSIALFAVMMILQGVAMAARAVLTLAGQASPPGRGSLEAEI